MTPHRVALIVFTSALALAGCGLPGSLCVDTTSTTPGTDVPAAAEPAPTNPAPQSAPTSLPSVSVPSGPAVDVSAIMTPDTKGMTSLPVVGDSADMVCGSLNVWATDEKSKTVGCAAIDGTDLYWVVYRSKDQSRLSVWQSHNGNSTRGGMSGKVTSITQVSYSAEGWDRIWIDSTSVDGAVVATFERDGAGYDVTIPDA